MLVKFTFPVTTLMVLSEPWPVTVEDITIEWRLESGQVTGLSASVPVSQADQLPSVQPSSTPGVKLHINLGQSTRQEDVEEAVRTLQGLLSLFTPLEIDFEHVEISWVPQTQEERDRVHLHSFVREADKSDFHQPRPLDYDLVARVMTSTKAAAHYEVPLGFLRRGTRAIRTSQYIEAFYNLFFFLETLFAPGYSNPKKVKAKLWAAVIVRNAVTRARSSFSKTNHLNMQKQT